MKIEIQNAEYKGRLRDERLWLKVKEDVPDLSVYQVADTTYRGGAVSNELRHLYWFKPESAKAGDWICLFSRNGRDRTARRQDGATTHFYHWRLGRSIWNKGGDQAVVFAIGAWTRKAV
jgi:hypothetical protein